MITLGVPFHVLDRERVVLPTRIEPLNGFALFPFPFGKLDDDFALLLGVLATVTDLHLLPLGKFFAELSVAHTLHFFFHKGHASRVIIQRNSKPTIVIDVPRRT